MKETTSKTTQIIQGNYPSVIDLAEAREQFSALRMQYQSTTAENLTKAMIDADPHYASRIGYFELLNTLKGKASLGPTIRATHAIKKILKPEIIDPDTAKRMARQGLSKAMSLEVIGCMTIEEPTNTATIIMSGILISVMVTVAALWWDDYKSGKFNRRHP